MKRRKFTKAALALSVCLVMLWAILGAGTTIAWFTDETPVAKNTFDIGDMNLVVSYKDENGEWIEIDENTEVFDDEALYEPGYTQVVYLKIENKGNVDFDYKLSVDMVSFVAGTSVMGSPIYLPNYLKFGAIIEETEAQLQSQLASRGLAQTNATIIMDDGEQPTQEMLPLNTYSSSVGDLDAEAGEDSIDYAALIIYMPEEIGNEANYRGTNVPEVELGITVFASQRGTLK